MCVRGNVRKTLISNSTTNKSLTSLKETTLKNYTQHVIGIIVLSMLIISMTFAAGYQLNEHGARAVGMGGAFVARASDPSAIYFNPAGLAFQQGINLYGGTTLIMPTNKFTGPTPLTTETSTNSQTFTPISLYGTYAINEDIVVGLGIYNPYGLGTDWPDTWVGKQLAVKTSVQTWYFNPSIGYKVNDQLSVGLGLSYVYGSASLSRKASLAALGMSSVYIKSQMDGTGSGFNVNFGAIYKPMDKLSVGMSYRMTTKLEFSGDLKFSELPASATVAALFPGGTGKVTLPMPGTLFVGAAYEVMPELTVEADVQLTQWSAYDQLKIDITPVTAAQGTSISPKNWADGYMLRLGGEYKYDDQFTFRGGFIYDVNGQSNSTVEPMLPDADRVDLSLGGSYKINDNIYVDATYMLVLFSERAVTSQINGFNGTYKSMAHLFGVSVGYKF
jgi:long-chain fatty acid transport protein